MDRDFMRLAARMPWAGRDERRTALLELALQDALEDALGRPGAPARDEVAKIKAFLARAASWALPKATLRLTRHRGAAVVVALDAKGQPRHSLMIRWRDAFGRIQDAVGDRDRIA